MGGPLLASREAAGIAIEPGGATISPLAGKGWLAERLAALGR